MSEIYVSALELDIDEVGIIDNRNSNVVKVEKIDKELNIEAVVEGLLYAVGEEGLKLEQVSAIIDKSLEDVQAIMESIKLKYQSSIFGFELVNYGKIYKFLTKKTIYPYLQKLFNETKNRGLSQSALETLAIIAYKQPITRIEIEELRGVGSDMMLRKLQARNLIKEVGRSESAGRPILYEVTEEFMDSFKLFTLDELPDLPQYINDENENLFD